MPISQKAQAPASTPPAAPQQPVPGGAAPGPSPLAGLRAHAVDLESALAGLRVQRQSLESQIRGQPREVRAIVAPQLAQVDLQIAGVSAELATTRAQIALQGGTTQPPAGLPPGRGRGLSGDDVTGIVIVFILAVLMPISLGMLRRLWRGAPKDRSAAIQDVISPRLDRLEQAVDAIAVEVERISEGQRFVTKVLVERPIAAPIPVAVPMHANEPASSLGEAKPFRALGAGPIEPIRVPERQAVRASITPH